MVGEILHIGRGLGEGGCFLIRSLRQRMNDSKFLCFFLCAKALGFAACRSALPLSLSVATERTIGTQE